MMAKKRKDDVGIRKRKNGTYEYRYTDPNTHERRSVGAKTLEEIREVKEKIRANTHFGLNTSGKNITLDEMYYLWKETKRGIKKNTFRNYCYMYERFVLNKFGKNKIQNLIRSDIKAFYNDLYDTKVMKVNTMDTIHNVIHQILETAVDDNYIRFNPASYALNELKKEENRKIQEREKPLNLHILTPSQERLFFDYLQKYPEYSKWYRVLKFLSKTGLRMGEFAALQEEDIHYDDRYIDINKTIVNYTVPAKNHKMGKLAYEIHSPKTKASRRTIPLTVELENLIKEEIEYHRNFDIECKVSVQNEEGKAYYNFLFLNECGSFYKDSAVNKALYRLIDKYNEEKVMNGKYSEQLPKISVHKFRHLFNSNLESCGIMVEERMAIMGHSSATVNMDVYTHVSQEAKTRAMLKFEEKQKENNYPHLVN